MPNVVLGLSGGAASAAALRLLIEQGAQVVAVTIDCPLADVDAARTSAEAAGVEFVVIDGAKAFERDVVHPWATQVSRGAEPDARALFTTQVLFPLLEREAQTRGCTHITTGHHARIMPIADAESACATHDAPDQSARKLDKQCRVIDDGTSSAQVVATVGVFAAEHASASDQSWLLGGIAPSMLEHLLLPCETTDIPVPDQAPQEAFPPADLQKLLRNLGLPDYPGDIVDKAGNVLGHYESLTAYRRGQALQFPDKASADLFVVAKDPARRRLVVAPREQTEIKECLINEINWLVSPPDGPLHVQAKVAPGLYSEAAPIGATVEIMGGMAMLCGSVGAITRFVPDAPSRLLIPGQPVAFYNNEGRLLGAGTLA